MDGIKHYRELLAKIGRFAEGWRDAPPFRLACRPGCDRCCRARLTVFAVEAAAMRAAGGTRLAGMGRRLGAPAGDRCAFLAGGECLVYDFRPVICRTQGFPVTYRDEGGAPRIDLCPETPFPATGIPPARVLDLDALNHLLASINRFHLAALARRGEHPPARVDLTTILDGNP
jgi:Fe-S-cluster containining protein